MRRFVLGLAAAGVVAAAGCYRNTGSFTPSAKTVLEVRNQSFDDMDIFVLPEGGAQVRVGMAIGKKDSFFVLPSFVLQGRTQPLRFVARPIATQRGPISDEIQATPGDTLVLLIPPG